MEATSDAQGLLGKIRAPRLEDAGLEDCALPPDSIKEAFLKAATAVGPRAASFFSSNSEEEEEGRSCVVDPWGEEEKLGDDLVGVRESVDPPPGACVAEKGGGVGEVMGDEVAAGLTEAEERMGDKVVDGREGVEEEGGEACVDGLKGLKIGEKKKDKNGEGEEDEGGPRPILGETFASDSNF